MALAVITKQAAKCPKCGEQSACDYVRNSKQVGSIPLWAVHLIGIGTGGLGYVLWPWRIRTETFVSLSCPKCNHVF